MGLSLCGPSPHLHTPASGGGRKPSSPSHCVLTAVPPPPPNQNNKEKGIKFAYQLVVTFGHITFRRTARVFPILTGPLHRQRAVAAEGVDEAGCMSQHITRTNQWPPVLVWHLHHSTWEHMDCFSTTVAPLTVLWLWNDEFLMHQMWPRLLTTFSLISSTLYQTKIIKGRSIKSLINANISYFLLVHCITFGLIYDFYIVKSFTYCA